MFTTGSQARTSASHHVAQEESAVIRQVLGGDRNAYALLIDRYNGPLFRYLVRMIGRPEEAEDLAQEAFLRAYLSLASYNDAYRFSTWLFRIATNLALNRIKAQRRIVSLEQFREGRQHDTVDQPADQQAEPDLPDPDETGRPDLALERTELAQAIRRCLDDLPEAYRAVVGLRHLADLSYLEISDSVGLPLNTVRSRLHRGRERLGECLEERLLGFKHQPLPKEKQP